MRPIVYHSMLVPFRLVEQKAEMCLYRAFSDAQAQEQINAFVCNSDSFSLGLPFGV